MSRDRTTLTRPTVHLNGTSRADLVEQYTTARQAVAAALQALSLASPHARDYYVQKDPGAFQAAVAEHESRCRRLREVSGELIDLLEGLAETPAAVTWEAAPATVTWDVIVGNVGNVYTGDDEQDALATFNKYVEQSRTGVGRAAGEPVTLLKGEDVAREYEPDPPLPQA